MPQVESPAVMVVQRRMRMVGAEELTGRGVKRQRDRQLVTGEKSAAFPSGYLWDCTYPGRQGGKAAGVSQMVVRPSNVPGRTKWLQLKRCVVEAGRSKNSTGPIRLGSRILGSQGKWGQWGDKRECQPLVLAESLIDAGTQDDALH